ncbi:hypothetical protein V8G54_004809, partial [Vigna mungo]
LIDPLNGDTIVISFVDSYVGVTELAVSQQFAQRVSLIEIFVVTEISALSARHLPRTCLVPFAIGRRYRRFWLRGSLGIFLVGDGVAIGAADFGGGIANSHGRRGSNTLKR